MRFRFRSFSHSGDVHVARRRLSLRLWLGIFLHGVIHAETRDDGRGRWGLEEAQVLTYTLWAALEELLIGSL